MGKLDEIKGWVDVDYILLDENISWDEVLNILLFLVLLMEEFFDFFVVFYYLFRKREIILFVFNFIIESDILLVDDMVFMLNIFVMFFVVDGYLFDGNI